MTHFQQGRDDLTSWDGQSRTDIVQQPAFRQGCTSYVIWLGMRLSCASRWMTPQPLGVSSA
jgi:hypothetical protein